MVGRLTRSADFQRLLATPMRARSAHFAVHHSMTAPSTPSRPSVHRSSTELSTVQAPIETGPVDESPAGSWLGTVVPKRLARRAVTRNLLRRQIRSAFERHARRLGVGCWLVRLRAPFPVTQFPSAASAALRDAAGAELDQLLQRMGR